MNALDTDEIESSLQPPCPTCLGEEEMETLYGQPETENVTPKENKLKLTEINGTEITGKANMIKIPVPNNNGATTFQYAVVLNEVNLSGTSVGNIFLYPMTGTKEEAHTFSKLINETIQTKQIEDTPVKVIQLHYLADEKVNLSELVPSIEKDKDVQLKIGRISFKAFKRDGLNGNNVDLSYGMSIK